MSGSLTTSPIQGNFVIDFRLGKDRLSLSEAHARLDGCAAEVEIHGHRMARDEVVLREETPASGVSESLARKQLTQDMQRMAEACGVDFKPGDVRVEQRVISPLPAPDFTKSVNQDDFVTWRRQQRDHPDAGKPVWVGEYHVKVRDGGQVLRNLRDHHGAELRYIELVERDGGALNVYRSAQEDPGNSLTSFMGGAQAAATVQGIEKRQDADAAARKEKALDDVRRMAEEKDRDPGTVEVAEDFVTVNGVRVPRQTGKPPA